MANCKIVRLDVEIPEETYNALVKITQRQNAALGNNVSRLLNMGIEATYDQWPNLRETRETST